MDQELIKGTLALLVLSLLGRKDMYGYEIVITVKEETSGTLQWKEGSLYPCLHRLEEAGLIVSHWREVNGSRPRKYYALTPAGRKAFREKMADWKTLETAVNAIACKEERT